MLTFSTPHCYARNHYSYNPDYSTTQPRSTPLPTWPPQLPHPSSSTSSFSHHNNVNEQISSQETVVPAHHHPVNNQPSSQDIDQSLRDFIKQYTDARLRQEAYAQAHAQHQQQHQQSFALVQPTTSVVPLAQPNVFTTQPRPRYQAAHSHSMSCLTSTDALHAPTSPLFGGASALDDFNTKPTMPGGDDSMSSFLSAWDAPRSGVAPPSGTTASGGDDFFSSPLWTDPSPALTDGNTFDVESCGPSPLLATDDLDRPAADVANMPLFGDMTLFSPAVRGDHHQSVAAPDFPLFPQAETMGVPAPPNSSSPPVHRAQMAFSAQPMQGEDEATMLLRALQGVVAARQAQAPVTSASPTMISSPPKELLHDLEMAAASMASAPAPASNATITTRPTMGHSATAPLLDVRATSSSSATVSPAPGSTEARPSCPRRGTKRRMGVTDLLPLDAPVQERNYLAPSATSRKDFFQPSSSSSTTDTSAAVDSNGHTAEDLAAIAAETDPLKAKRLSNTLAARRSRHRKAQEAAEREGKIRELQEELAQYKRRLMRVEDERDALLEEREQVQRKRCRCGGGEGEE